MNTINKAHANQRLSSHEFPENPSSFF